MGEQQLIKRGLLALLTGALLGVTCAALISTLLTIPTYGGEILARTRPNNLDLIVALLAGMVGAFAKARPSVADSLAGVAVSVALMPPLCVVGIGLAQSDWLVSFGALLLYLTNLIGIAIACHITFFIMGYTTQRHQRWVSRGAI